MGGVATAWRAREAELALSGARVNEQTFKRAADAECKRRGYEHNRFKIELGRRAVVRALTVAAGEGRTA